MFRLVPPTGTPINWKNIRDCLYCILTNKDNLIKLINRIKTEYNIKYCLALSSGRAALTVALKSLFELVNNTKDEVIIPAYTCYSVPASTIRVGLRIRLCDINIKTLDFNYSQLEQFDFSRVLAIITSNLFGIPNDLPRITKLAKKNQIFVVDDACQAFGARIANKFSGSWGTVGIISFDRGKNITALGGGLIITNSAPLARITAKSVNSLSNDSFKNKVEIVFKLLVYCVMLHPWLYRIPHNLPFLKLGKTIFNANFPIEGFYQIRAAIALEMLNRLYHINNIRKSKALYLINQIIQSDKFQFINPYPISEPVYLRLPLVVQSKTLRDKLITEFQKKGIVTTGMYPFAIHQIPEVQNALVNRNENFSGAEELSQRILTLPTHPFVSDKDLEKIANVLDRVNLS